MRYDIDPRFLDMPHHQAKQFPMIMHTLCFDVRSREFEGMSSPAGHVSLLNLSETGDVKKGGTTVSDFNSSVGQHHQVQQWCRCTPFLEHDVS